MATQVPSRDHILGNLAAWRLYEALGLPDESPPARVLVQIAKVQSAHKDLTHRLHLVQKLLTGHREYYLRTRKQIKAQLQSLTDQYGPRLLDLLEAKNHSVLETVVEAAEKGRDPAEALAEVAHREVRKLQELRASPGDTRLEATAHPSHCPICGGTGWVEDDDDGDDGPAVRELVGQELRRAIQSDPDLRAQMKEEMRRQHIPSWVEPEEFAEIFEVGVQVQKRSKPNRRKPCPRVQELVFEIPEGAKPGWVLASTPAEPGEKPDFVRVRFV